MMWILVVLLCGVSASALVLLSLIVRARNRRRLQPDTHGATCDAPECIGISVLCSGVRQIVQVENLLSAEYSRYEVIVVLDSQRYPAEFAELASRYRMIRVEYVPTREFPSSGIRELGRSRRRSFRRLVLIDRAEDSPGGDFDAAAGVASYDYLLPLREGCYLMPDTIERLVAEAGERPSGEIALVRSWVGESVSMFCREAVAAAGGFTRHPAGRIPRARRRVIWEPLCCAARPVKRISLRIRAIVGVLLGVGIVWSVVAGQWVLAAPLVTVALVWMTAECARQVLVEIAGPCFPGFVAWWCYRHKLNL